MQFRKIQPATDAKNAARENRLMAGNDNCIDYT